MLVFAAIIIGWQTPIGQFVLQTCPEKIYSSM